MSLELESWDLEKKLDFNHIMLRESEPKSKSKLLGTQESEEESLATGIWIEIMDLENTGIEIRTTGIGIAITGTYRSHVQLWYLQRHFFGVTKALVGDDLFFQSILFTYKPGDCTNWATLYLLGKTKPPTHTLPIPIWAKPPTEN